MTDNSTDKAISNSVALQESLQKIMELRPADIAKECGVSVGTVRNWCADYAEFLSPRANPNDGNRLLNERDLEICRYIAGLRKEGMSKPQIILRLRETSFGHVDTEQPIANPIEPLQSQQESLQEGLQQAPGVIVALEAMQRQIDAIQQAAQQADRRRFDPVTSIGLGFVGGLLFCAILIMLAWLYSG